MDFFQAQDHARKKSKFLVVYFVAAVVSIIAVIYAVTILVLTQSHRGPEFEAVVWWQPEVFALVAGGTLVVIFLGSLFKTLALRSGGATVARSVGGVRVDSDTTNPGERRLLNVVEEMAIASGVRVPEVYLLPEDGINAFAAGWTADDAAIAVTQGALNTLTRDELQGVIAHEFSHILNGDMRINLRLIGLLFGILLLAIIGRVLLQSLRFSGGSRSRGKNSGGIVVAMLALGLTLLIVGYVGVLFGRLIQAAVSRQREFLADASAVQFTRNPLGIEGALKKIGGLAAGARVRNAHATETGHMFFANALSASAMNLFATHPPLEDRIRAIDPAFDGKFPDVTMPVVSAAAEPPARPRRSAPPPLRPEQFIAAVAAASTAQPAAGAALIASIPGPLLAAARDPARARAVVLALLASADDPAAGQRQAVTVHKTLSPVEVQAGAEAVPLISALSTESRFALLDLALPALRTLPPPAMLALLAAIDEMVLADYRVTSFEFAIQHILRRNLRVASGDLPAQSGAPNAAAQSADVAAVLAAMARAGAGRALTADAAFAAGARHFGLPETRLDARDPGPSALTQLAVVLHRLERIAPEQKRKLLDALAVAAGTDGVIEADEVALLRAFAAALDCPAPVLHAA